MIGGSRIIQKASGVKLGPLLSVAMFNSLAGSSPNYSQGIGYSPSTPASPASSGVPSFRSLRSFLPFGPNKNATSLSTSSPNNLSRSPFAGFGSVRRSMTQDREPKASLSNDTPIIAIEKSNGDPIPDTTAVIRRSVSLSNLDKPLPSQPSSSSSALEDKVSPSMLFFYLFSFIFSIFHVFKKAFSLRTPSPGPPLSAELSTIIEADNSGVSKHITANSSPTATTKSIQGHDNAHTHDVDTSVMDLSTTHLADQVRDAIREGGSLKDQWLNTDKAAVIIDADEHPDVADTMNSVDRDFLSLHSTTKQVPLETSSTPSSNPTTPNFLASPASRLPLARQVSSFLPRFRSSNSSSPSPQLPIHQTPPPTPPSSSIVVNGNGYNDVKPSSSPALPITSTPTPIASRRSITLNHTPRLFSPSTASPKVQNGSTRNLRQVMLGVRTTNEGLAAAHDSTSSLLPSRPTRITLGRSSLDSRRPTTENGATAIGLGRPMSRGASSDSRTTRPNFDRSSTSPERTETTPSEAEEDLPDIPSQECRPSLDSNITTRPSFDGIAIIRPNSAAALLRDRDGRRTPSLRVADTTAVRDRASPIPKIPNPPVRTRKRSMSVQERYGKGRNEDLARSGSSLSSYGTKESGSSVSESCASASSGPKMEWLGPRTAKAFRAAGLLDFDREREREKEEGSEPTTGRLRDRSSSTSGVLSPSPLGVGNSAPTLNRFVSPRSASEYNPLCGRSHSRLTVSEAGSGARRGSGSFSFYGGNGGGGGGGGGSPYGHAGLMESPTITGSSGRDTPKSSISTAPTSLADSFGYLGRDRDMNRERERERDEMREMKERHGTEMGALLGALSDSQRTVRMLREENSDLRDGLERFTGAVQANHELRQVCADLQSECSSLRRENTNLRKELIGLRGLAHSWSGGSGSKTPVPKAANSSSPLSRTYTAREEYDNTFIDHGSEVENHLHYQDSPDLILPPSSPVSSKKRRLSNSSSIFPIPPSNMTLLLHEDAISTLGSIAGSCSVSEHSQYLSPPPSTQRKSQVVAPDQSSSSPPISYHNFASSNIPRKSSVTSVGSISSPSTTNFSIVTGSPRSLFLRPEHEILLGDMESLDLGVRGGGDGDGDDGSC